EDAHRAALRPEQTQNVPDERRLPRAVCADEAIDRPAREGEAHRVQGRRGTEATRQLRDADNRFTHTLIYGSTGNEGPSSCLTTSERGILSVACVVPGTLPNADRAEREQMRELKIMEHISLDGVIQHSADDGDFPYGDWTTPYRTPAGRDAILAAYGERFDLLLGRRTYDIWSGFWPKAPSSPIADGLNAATKYVATHRPESLAWRPCESL